MAFRLFLDLQRHNAAPSHLLYLHSNPKAHITSVALFLGMTPCCCSLIFTAAISLASATLPQLHCWLITFIPLKLPKLPQNPPICHDMCISVHHPPNLLHIQNHHSMFSHLALVCHHWSDYIIYTWCGPPVYTCLCSSKSACAPASSGAQPFPIFL